MRKSDRERVGEREKERERREGAREREREIEREFFIFRVLHTIFSHLRAHAFARSVTVARSSAVHGSSSGPTVEACTSRALPYSNICNILLPPSRKSRE